MDLSSSGFDAVSKVSKNFYDLIITDIQMPGMDGYSATQTLREQGYEKPIIALTANALRGEEARAQASGMDAYLTKPVALQLLKETLERWVPSATAAPAPTR